MGSLKINLQYAVVTFELVGPIALKFHLKFSDQTLSKNWVSISVKCYNRTEKEAIMHAKQ